MEYTQEQKADIEVRFKEAVEFLKSKEINIAASVQKINVGNDIFADKVSAFLVDTKYSNKEGVPSPFNGTGETKEEKS